MATTDDLLAGLLALGGTPRPFSAVAAVTDPARIYTIAGAHPGLLIPGNIDLAHRPIVHNPDGTISTVRSASFGLGGHEVLLPTVVGGRVVTPAESLLAYRRTGQHLGIFATPAAANAYAERLHQEQARAYTGGRP